MEECEALCTRLVIMVDGTFRCLGSPRHLKKKFGSGHTLKIRALDKGDVSDVVELKEYIDAAFPKGKLIEENLVELTYDVSDVTWGNVFRSMEQIKSVYNVEYYSVSEATLEQVFLTVSSKSSKRKAIREALKSFAIYNKARRSTAAQ